MRSNDTSSENDLIENVEGDPLGEDSIATSSPVEQKPNINLDIEDDDRILWLVCSCGRPLFPLECVNHQ